MTTGLRFAHLFGGRPAPQAEGPPADAAPDDPPAFAPCADCANPEVCRAADACYLDGTGDDGTDAPAEGEGPPAGEAAARRAERRRIAGILAAPAAAGRGEFALHLALHTAMPAPEAVALLAAAPMASAPSPAPAPRDRLATAMAAQRQPALGPGDGEAGAGQPSRLVEHMRRKYRRP